MRKPNIAEIANSLSSCLTSYWNRSLIAIRKPLWSRLSSKSTRVKTTSHLQNLRRSAASKNLCMISMGRKSTMLTRRIRWALICCCWWISKDKIRKVQRVLIAMSIIQEMRMIKSWKLQCWWRVSSISGLETMTVPWAQFHLASINFLHIKMLICWEARCAYSWRSLRKHNKISANSFSSHRMIWLKCRNSSSLRKRVYNLMHQ